MNNARILSAAAILGAFASARAQAPCVGWDERFHPTGIIGPVVAQAVYDDGSGPALFYGGSFISAGAHLAEQVAKWDGASWSALGGGVDHFVQIDRVTSLAVFDEGQGDLLFVGGEFSSVDDGLAAQALARWNGTSWSALPLELADGARVLDLQVWDDGSGPALFVAGRFTDAGGVTVNHIAKWDGTSWSALSTGLGGGPSPLVFDLELFDDGTGVALYATGSFAQAGGAAASNLAKWDGATWSAVGGGCNLAALALGVFDDGGGDELYLSGFFTQAGTLGANGLAKWDGTAWSSLGSGFATGYYADDFQVYDEGNGPVLFAGGRFLSISGVPARHIARWDGAAWSALPQQPDEAVYALSVFDDGAGGGTRLFAGGQWRFIGSSDLRSPATWDGAQWASLGEPGLGLSGVGGARQTFAFDDGSGPAILSSQSSSAGTQLQRFDGNSWTTWAGLDGTVDAYALHDDGINGEQLYVGGYFTQIDGVAASRVARWTGSTWAPLSSGISGGDQFVNELFSFDDGNAAALWACGNFNMAGGQQARRVARWNGTSWSEPGGGVSGQVGTTNGARAFALYDEGAGPRLFIAGAFSSAGGSAIACLARWNGASWESVGGGLNGPVEDLVVFDDGSGAALYAVGSFTNAGGTPVQHVARWNGASWSGVGGGTNAPLSDAAVFDDGSGAQLYVSGIYNFTSAGGTAVQGLARWNGSAWSDVDGGVFGQIVALEPHDDPLGMGPSLWLAGNFSLAGGLPSSNIARYGRTWPCVTSYCSAGTSANGCAPTLSASGSPSASQATPFVVSANNVEGQKIGLIFYGLGGATSAPWGTTSSLLCVKPPQQRMSQSSSGGTSGACDGTLSVDWNAYHASHPGALGSPFSAGTDIWLQGWYRDPPSGKTTALSDALATVMCP